MVEFLGPKERVLIEKKNFAKEMEDVPRPGALDDSSFRLEEALSLTEQIHKVDMRKNMTPA